MVITSDAPDAPTVYVMSSGNTAVSMIGNHATEAVLSVINGGGGPTLSSAPKEEITDTALSRSVSYSEASAAEHSLASLILAALESSLSGTTWTIKRTDGSTIHITKTVTTSGSVDPITGVS
jgi:protein involved in polysaccharide export with SLBB domain